MLLITSACGSVGRQIIPYLAKHGVDIRAVDINPKVADYKAQGVKETMVIDATKADQVEKAMQGVDQVVYIPTLFSFQEYVMGKIAIDAAIKEGVKQFIDISVLFPNLDTKLHHMMKKKVEHYLLYRGFESHMLWTVLQPSGYNHDVFLEQFYKLGKFPNYTPLDKRMSWFDALDEADVIMKVMDRPEYFDKGVYQLCNEKLNSYEVADMMTEITGKDIKAEYVDEDHLADYFPQYFHGGDSYSYEAFIRLVRTMRKWGWDSSSFTLEALLDHKPRTMHQYLEREAKRLGIYQGAATK